MVFVCTKDVCSFEFQPSMRYEEALRIAEERDARLRAAFDRFDLDGSQTIDMEELLPLMDDLGLVSDLKSDKIDFAAAMFEKCAP